MRSVKVEGAPLPGVFELDERERGPAPVLQVDESHLPELVEEVLDVFGADVRGEIAHIDTALVAAPAASASTSAPAPAPAAPAAAAASASASGHFEGFDSSVNGRAEFNVNRFAAADEADVPRWPIDPSVRATNEFVAF